MIESEGGFALMGNDSMPKIKIDNIIDNIINNIIDINNIDNIIYSSSSSKDI